MCIINSNRPQIAQLDSNRPCLPVLLCGVVAVAGAYVLVLLDVVLVFVDVVLVVVGVVLVLEGLVLVVGSLVVAGRADVCCKVTCVVDWVVGENKPVREIENTKM